MNSLGEKIAKVRKQKGYSQDYMANLLDISQSSYAKYETEATDITVKRLQEISNILEEDMASFFNNSTRTINISDFKDNSINNYIETQVTEAKELSTKLIETLEKENEYLRSQIDFFKSIIVNQEKK